MDNSLSQACTQIGCAEWSRRRSSHRILRTHDEYRQVEPARLQANLRTPAPGLPGPPSPQLWIRSASGPAPTPAGLLHTALLPAPQHRPGTPVRSAVPPELSLRGCTRGAYYRQFARGTVDFEGPPGPPNPQFPTESVDPGRAPSTPRIHNLALRGHTRSTVPRGNCRSGWCTPAVAPPRGVLGSVYPRGVLPGPGGHTAAPSRPPRRRGEKGQIHSLPAPARERGGGGDAPPATVHAYTMH